MTLNYAPVFKPRCKTSIKIANQKKDRDQTLTPNDNFKNFGLVSRISERSGSQIKRPRTKPISDVLELFQPVSREDITSHCENQCNDGTKDADLSRIKFLALSNLRIRGIGDVSLCSNVTILLLANNYITDISPLATCTHLIKLDLHSNQIRKLPEASFWLGLPQLLILLLHDNILASFSDISGLPSCHQLAVLTLCDTAVCTQRMYRHHVVNSILSLKVLDEYLVSDEEIVDDLKLGSTRFEAFGRALHIKLVERATRDQPAVERVESAWIKKTMLRINFMLAHYSPVIIVQRCIRGHLSRKRTESLRRLRGNSRREEMKSSSEQKTVSPFNYNMLIFHDEIRDSTDSFTSPASPPINIPSAPTPPSDAEPKPDTSRPGSRILIATPLPPLAPSCTPAASSTPARSSTPAASSTSATSSTPTLPDRNDPEFKSQRYTASPFGGELFHNGGMATVTGMVSGCEAGEVELGGAAQMDGKMSRLDYDTYLKLSRIVLSANSIMATKLEKRAEQRDESCRKFDLEAGKFATIEASLKALDGTDRLGVMNSSNVKPTRFRSMLQKRSSLPSNKHMPNSLKDEEKFEVSDNLSISVKLPNFRVAGILADIKSAPPSRQDVYKENRLSGDEIRLAEKLQMDQRKSIKETMDKSLGFPSRHILPSRQFTPSATYRISNNRTAVSNWLSQMETVDKLRHSAASANQIAARADRVRDVKLWRDGAKSRVDTARISSADLAAFIHGMELKAQAEAGREGEQSRMATAEKGVELRRDARVFEAQRSADAAFAAHFGRLITSCARAKARHDWAESRSKVGRECNRFRL